MIDVVQRRCLLANSALSPTVLCLTALANRGKRRARPPRALCAALCGPEMNWSSPHPRLGVRRREATIFLGVWLATCTGHAADKPAAATPALPPGVVRFDCGDQSASLAIFASAPSLNSASCTEQPAGFFECRAGDSKVLADCAWGCTQVSGNAGCLAVQQLLARALVPHLAHRPYFALTCAASETKEHRVYLLNLAENDECTAHHDSRTELAVECGQWFRALTPEGRTWVPKLRADCETGCQATVVEQGRDCTELPLPGSKE